MSCEAWHENGVRGPSTAAIGPGEVHGWLIDLDRPGAGAAVLDAAERDRAAAYLRPADGAAFAASRAGLRAVLSGYLGCEPGCVRFAAGRRGRPRLAGHDLLFSLSRGGALALVAVSAGPVGADLESVQPRPGLTDLAAARFGPTEVACMTAGCGGSLVRGFYRHWTAKEAYLKAVGRGLAGLRDAELVCGTDPVIRFRREPQAGWRLSVPAVPAGYAAAVVAAGPVTSWRWLAG